MDIYRILYIGDSGSGKTYRMLEDLKSVDRKNADIYLVSSTAEHQPIYEKNSHLFTGYWDSLTEDVLGEIEILVENHSNKKHIVLVFDDVGNSLRKVNEERLNDLITNARHIPITLIFLIQKITQGSPILRLNGDMFVIFATSTKSELKWISDEFGGTLTPSKMRELCRKAWSEPYGYLRIIKSKPRTIFLDGQGNLLY